MLIVTDWEKIKQQPLMQINNTINTSMIGSMCPCRNHNNKRNEKISLQCKEKHSHHYRKMQKSMELLWLSKKRNENPKEKQAMEQKCHLTTTIMYL